MTRINVIPPAELTDKHLLAEYRELPRLFKQSRPCDDAPAEYKLGVGHVKFFYDKLGYLDGRFIDLKEEMIRRGFNTSAEFSGYVFKQMMCKFMSNPELFNGYEPTPEAIKINRARIAERLATIER